MANTPMPLQTHTHTGIWSPVPNMPYNGVP